MESVPLFALVAQRRAIRDLRYARVEAWVVLGALRAKLDGRT